VLQTGVSGCTRINPPKGQRNRVRTPFRSRCVIHGMQMGSNATSGELEGLSESGRVRNCIWGCRSGQKYLTHPRFIVRTLFFVGIAGSRPALASRRLSVCSKQDQGLGGLGVELDVHSVMCNRSARAQALVTVWYRCCAWYFHCHDLHSVSLVLANVREPTNCRLCCQL